MIGILLTMKVSRKHDNRSNSCIAKLFTIGLPALILGGIGLTMAYAGFLGFVVPWERHMMEAPPKNIVDIAHVEFESSVSDPIGDTVYVTTEDGAVYSNTLFKREWNTTESIPIWDYEYWTICAPEWPGAQSGSLIWDPPPVVGSVKDSVGIRIERPLSIIVRCYVLLEDETLEVWTRGEDAYSMIGRTLVFTFSGILLGTILGFLLHHNRLRGKVLVLLV